jgi:hypothetical protein
MAEQLDLFPQEELQQQDAGSVQSPELTPIADAEWCFQFFNNEPITFAWSNEGEEAAPLVLQIQPQEGEGLNFQQNGMTFRIFPRPITEETKQARKEQNESKNQTTEQSGN